MKYFLTDHLGSVVAVTDAGGSLLSQQRYLPFGGVRTDVGTITQTDFGYTFQRDLDVQPGYDLGLMVYKARFYDPSLQRWTQPDSLIPDSNPQNYNRYTYVLQNPLSFVDPTGHRELEYCSTDVECDESVLGTEDDNTKVGNSSPGLSAYGVTTTGFSSSADILIVASAIEAVANAMFFFCMPPLGILSLLFSFCFI